MRPADKERAGGSFALLTDPGPAAIAVIRVRGPDTDAFLRRHVRLRDDRDSAIRECGRVLRGELVDDAGEPLDDVLISIHADPPERDVRIHLHGSPWLVSKCEELLKTSGLQAEREPVAPLWPAAATIEDEAYRLAPEMLTLAGARWLLAQRELLPREVRRIAQLQDLDAAKAGCRELLSRAHLARWFKTPLRAALVGPPNAGKSTLANALADRQVAVVSPRPGTTRDWIEVWSQADGFPVIWLDTAGLGASRDELEAAGIARTEAVLASSDVRVAVIDATPDGAARLRAFVERFGDLDPHCVALNKIDALDDRDVSKAMLPAEWRERVVAISALKREGLDALAAAALHAGGRRTDLLEQAAPFNDRQCRRLAAAADAPDLEALAERLAAVVHAEFRSDG